MDVAYAERDPPEPGFDLPLWSGSGCLSHCLRSDLGFKSVCEAPVRFHHVLVYFLVVTGAKASRNQAGREIRFSLGTKSRKSLCVCDCALGWLATGDLRLDESQAKDDTQLWLGGV